MKTHNFFKLMGAVKESLASDYERIRSRSREDPGTAGDQAEEDWAEILRNWLPANYRVVTKGRILFEDGTSSPQMDVLVLTASYPRGLGNEKYVLSGGVVAAFECKLTLRKADIKKAFETACQIKRKAEARVGNPYEELNRPPIVGLLAHSQSLGRGRKSWKLYDAVETYQDKCSDHPRELLDIICVADSATIALSKVLLVGNDLTKDELEELENLGVSAAIAAMYTIQDEENPSTKLAIDDTGAILAGLVYELTVKLAFEDEAIRSWADHLSNLGFYGGIGRPFYCAEDILSEQVRARLKLRGGESDRWSKWNRHLP
jgi:hypothetical protein